MDAVRWLVGLGIGGPAALLILGNWLSILGTLSTKRPTSLIFPFFCGPIAALACWICPDARVRSLAWCPLILDPSTSLVLPILLIRWGARCFGHPSPSEEPED